MFYGCSSLISLSGVSNFNTVKVTNVKKIFYNCPSLKFWPDISSWNLNKIIKESNYFQSENIIRGELNINLKEITNNKAILFNSEHNKLVTVYLNHKKINMIKEGHKWIIKKACLEQNIKSHLP